MECGSDTRIFYAEVPDQERWHLAAQVATSSGHQRIRLIGSWTAPADAHGGPDIATHTVDFGWSARHRWKRSLQSAQPAEGSHVRTTERAGEFSLDGIAQRRAALRDDAS